ncbi:hypothetical protein ACI3L1_05820 [Deinococcus sp. SM5_A1]|uniref:hypothetical protein n=1 Tax=Deinococcus sp. SM5_A1 TaxID=3379094 RepID=UPI00385CE757
MSAHGDQPGHAWNDQQWQPLRTPERQRQNAHDDGNGEADAQSRSQQVHHIPVSHASVDHSAFGLWIGDGI